MLCKTKTYYDKDLKMWSGENGISIYNPNVSVGQVILSSFRKNPYNIAQISDNNGLKFTNEEMEIRSVRVIKNLLKLNFKKGDVLGIVSSNNDKIGAIAIAALTIGMPLSSLDHNLSRSEIKHLFMITTPKIIVCEHFNQKIVQEVAKEIKNETKAPYKYEYEMAFFIIDDRDTAAAHDDDRYDKSIQSVEKLFEKCDETDDHFYVPPDIKDGETTFAAVMFTSGTTGPPKGVCLSHSILLRNFIAFHPYIATDIALCFSTLYWISGLMSLISGAISGCTRIITTEPFTPELGLRLIEKYKVSFLMTSPYQLSGFVQCDTITNYNLSHLKLYCVGGSKVNAEHCNLMQKYLKNGVVRNAYGLSEIGLVSNSIYQKNVTNWNSVGMLTENISIQLLDKNRKPIGINEIGEICVKYKNYKFLGYCDATKYHSFSDRELWMDTGDLGYFDDDGCLYIEGRIKDILKYKNYQISPSELENIIYRLSSDILSVTVIGIPDGIGNDLPAAVIIKKSNSNINENQVYDYVAANISKNKLLRGGIYFVDKFPLTPSGKIKRTELQKFVIEQFSSHKSK